MSYCCVLCMLHPPKAVKYNFVSFGPAQTDQLIGLTASRRCLMCQDRLWDPGSENDPSSFRLFFASSLTWAGLLFVPLQVLVNSPREQQNYN